MAVKVMFAPVVVAQRDPTAAPQAARSEPRPKRRRATVFDAEGHEVFITLMCLKCRKMRPLSQFGLRRMADGAIRNQPWCRPCRNGASAENQKRKREGAPPVSLVQEPEAPAAPPLDASLLAAQVVAALQGGRG